MIRRGADEQRGEFFTLRMCLAFISSFCEARFYRAVVEALNERVGRYLLFFLLTGAGMYNASIGASCDPSIHYA